MKEKIFEKAELDLYKRTMKGAFSRTRFYLSHVSCS